MFPLIQDQDRAPTLAFNICRLFHLEENHADHFAAFLARLPS